MLIELNLHLPKFHRLHFIWTPYMHMIHCNPKMPVFHAGILGDTSQDDPDNSTVGNKGKTCNPCVG